MVKAVYAVTAAVIITALVVGGGAWYFLSPAPPADVLEIYHWWTSGGEKSAIDALVDVFEDKYPDTAVIQSPVAGGAGYVMKAVMKSLVLAGEAPDAFQMHAGYEGKPYFDADYLEAISDLWEEEEWEDVFPEVVKDMVNFEGEYYAVPVNIHRPNVVWYNKPLLDDNDIDPADLTTWDAFFDACDTLVAADIDSPIALGDVGKWTDTHVLEQIIAGEGIDFYEDWINGKVTSATDPKLLSALETFKTYLDYVNEDHSALTWDEAIKRVITGDAAFSVMGDWANGEFYVADKVYGTDYGTFPTPGTSGMYGLVIDCFQHPKGVKHPENSLNWLRVVGSKEGQDTFNPIKGSIAARTDADETEYGLYQKAAIADFKAAASMYPSVAHGSGAPEAFTAELDDIMSAFVTNKNVNAAATALTDATKDASADYTIVWSLD
ncbi:MAG: ABC transporter substrate-binding protein [Candidatus Bathyarchaeota archaeon]|nr:ABC transporter substrate-binding protein [Candidatus Bathyarchaeota archaeon]